MAKTRSICLVPGNVTYDRLILTRGTRVLDDLDRTLTADLARTLEFDPVLTRDEAAKRVTHLAAEQGLLGLDGRISQLASSLRVRGVINPRYLQDRRIRTHFFLANGRPGLLGQVIRDTEHVKDGVSQYVVYGHWDSLLIVNGSADEASSLMTTLEEGAYETPVRFQAEDVLLAFRHRLPEAFEPVPGVTDEQINQLALDYDSEKDRDLRDALRAANVLIGPALTLEGGQASPYPITAFIGITLRSRAYIPGIEILDALLSQDDLRRCMTHLFQIGHGVFFNYFVKITCASVEELDKATNAVAFVTHRGIRLEGETLVVAHGSEQLPLVRNPDVTSVLLAPDVGPMLRTAQQVFDRLGTQEKSSFNSLSGDRQLATLRALNGLRASADIAVFDSETREQLESAITTFSRESTKADGSPNLTGPVVEITSLVERIARRLLDALATEVLGDDQAMIQRELKLPTRKIWNLALGKAAQALMTARTDGRFDKVQQHMPEDWVERLARFADERNAWAHGAVQGSHTQVIDQAFATMREGIEIAAWISLELSSIGEAAKPRRVQSRRGPKLNIGSRVRDGDFSVFVSHSSTDSVVASRLAMGLEALGYRSWYDEWELHGGDSIVDRIQKALSACDVLLVVLSPRSVASEWVKRELNAGLMRELSGHSVVVIPVLIEDCDIPALLEERSYIDLRNNFEDGFLSLLDSLRQHREAITG
jgi:hypothetical protein